MSEQFRTCNTILAKRSIYWRKSLHDSYLRVLL